MKKKVFTASAFTLMELLAVIIIISLLIVIIAPVTYNLINKTKGESYYKLIDIIESSARLYVSRNFEEIAQIVEEEGIYEIPLDDLVSSRLLKEPLIDPRNDQEISLTNKVLVILKDIDNSVFSYCYQDGDRECPEPLLTLALKIKADEDVEHKNIDTSNEARFYVGPNPNNWIEFGTIDNTPILWRIIKSNSEGIKIIYEGKKNGVSAPDDDGHITVNGADFIPWDRSGAPCGSNKWERPADLKEPLQTWYTTILTKNEQHIAPIKWCIGASGINEADYLDKEIPLSEFLETECVSGTYEYDVFGNIYIEEFLGKTVEASGVGLIRASDYISTSNAETCTGSSFYDADMDFEFGSDCGIKDGISTNFLYKSSYLWWTHTAYAAGPSAVWRIHVSGHLGIEIAFNDYGIRPVLNLKPSILYDSGEGTIESPYIVK